MKWYDPTSWFKEWQWLKCADKEWNYARIVGLTLFIWNMTEVDLAIIPQINSAYAALAYCKGIVAGMFLFGYEVIRGVKKLEFTRGDTSFNLNKGKENGKRNPNNVDKD